jgi:hypothetical protein
MKLKDVIAVSALAVGLGVGTVVGAGVASAAPGAPGAPGTDIAQRPHHGDGPGWDDHRGPGPGHGRWINGGWNGVDACVSAAGPLGYVSGYACI